MNCYVLIPARMESERFPNKPLVKILGHPMIAHVALRSKLSKIVEDAIVCTDSPEIIKVCDLYGIKTILTKSIHKNGSERIAEAVDILKLSSDDQIIDVQGDEPLVHPKYIEAVSSKLNEKDVECVVPFQEIHIKNDVNIVKIIESNDKILAFSRADVPANFGGPSQALKKHLDVIGFKMSGLKFFAKNSPGPLEKMERVELYRVLEGGGKIHTFKMFGQSISVNTPKDHELVCRIMETDQLFDNAFKSFKL